MTDLEQRLQRWEDLEAIRRLKHYNYCHCVDRAVAGESSAIDETISRFSDDVVADFTGFPLAEGREAVAAFYAQGVPSILSYSQHHVFNEVLDIDGDQATGLWYVHCPVNFTEASPLGKAGPGLVMGRYEEQYVREGGAWKWRKIVALLEVIAPGEMPWAGATQLSANPHR
jgi:hypothetical protein